MSTDDELKSKVKTPKHLVEKITKPYQTIEPIDNFSTPLFQNSIDYTAATF